MQTETMRPRSQSPDSRSLSALAAKCQLKKQIQSVVSYKFVPFWRRDLAKRFARLLEAPGRDPVLVANFDGTRRVFAVTFLYDEPHCFEPTTFLKPKVIVFD
jgi:hypothetical protein